MLSVPGVRFQGRGGNRATSQGRTSRSGLPRTHSANHAAYAGAVVAPRTIAAYRGHHGKRPASGSRAEQHPRLRTMRDRDVALTDIEGNHREPDSPTGITACADARSSGGDPCECSSRMGAPGAVLARHIHADSQLPASALLSNPHGGPMDAGDTPSDNEPCGVDAFYGR